MAERPGVIPIIGTGGEKPLQFFGKPIGAFKGGTQPTPAPVTAGGGASGNTAPPLPPPTSPTANTPLAPIENKVERDPLVAQSQENVQKYIEGSNEFANRAMESAGLKTRDAFEGVFKGLDADAARRGISGSGAHGVLTSRRGEDLVRALAQQNEDIALGEHKNIGDVLSNQGNLALGAQAGMQAQQRVGLDTYRTQLDQVNQGFNQMLALANQYPQKQPATYYEESDPETAPVYQPEAPTGVAGLIAKRFPGLAGGIGIRR